MSYGFTAHSYSSVLIFSLITNNVVVTKSDEKFSSENFTENFTAKPFLTNKEKTIFWYKGFLYSKGNEKDEPFMKWEISDDFTEIKEYRKDGEDWVLQSVMKKVPESENKKAEK